MLTIVAFSMERFLAICHPLHLRKMSGLQRAIRINPVTKNKTVLNGSGIKKEADIGSGLKNKSKRMTAQKAHT